VAIAGQQLAGPSTGSFAGRVPSASRTPAPCWPRGRRSSRWWTTPCSSSGPGRLPRPGEGEARRRGPPRDRRPSRVPGRGARRADGARSSTNARARSRSWSRCPGSRISWWALRPGGAARGEVAGALVVPPAALVRDGADPAVRATFVVRQGKAEKVAVGLGVEAPDGIQVHERPRAGDVVVLDPPTASPRGRRSTSRTRPGRRQVERTERGMFLSNLSIKYPVRDHDDGRVGRPRIASYAQLNVDSSEGRDPGRHGHDVYPGAGRRRSSARSRRRSRRRSTPSRA